MPIVKSSTKQKEPLKKNVVEPKNILYEVRTREEFRNWLSEHHDKEKECWLISRGKSRNEFMLWYCDMVEEALCFGWIDSLVKRVDAGVAHKISPRKKTSQWSELNKERCRRLEKLGLMTPAGRAVLPDLSEESFIINPDVLKALQNDSQTWENFQKFPPLYQRIRIDYVQRVKKNETMYESRLKNFLDKTKQNIMFGEWNDRGRLLQY